MKFSIECIQTRDRGKCRANAFAAQKMFDGPTGHRIMAVLPDLQNFGTGQILRPLALQRVGVILAYVDGSWCPLLTRQNTTYEFLRISNENAKI